MTPRQIIHLDLDAFYASVEVLLDPSLAGRPVVVGGSPEARGVVASASYPARAYGVRSAMPMREALRLCPEAIVIPPHFELYAAYSRRVMAILHHVTPLVEQLSIDEAFLDVTAPDVPWDRAVEIARALQTRIRDEVGLSASLGVATNKLVAKIASDEGKPGGLVVVRPGEEANFLSPLPVRKLWGVGPVTAQRLNALGVTTIGELSRLSLEQLVAEFGKSQGTSLYQEARGLDERPVEPYYERKSVSQEHTFPRDVRERGRLVEEIRRLSAGVAEDLRREGRPARTITLKLRRADFSTVTRSRTLPAPTDDEEVISTIATALFDGEWRAGEPIRLLGVRASNLTEAAGYQLPLPQSPIPNSPTLKGGRHAHSKTPSRHPSGHPHLARRRVGRRRVRVRQPALAADQWDDPGARATGTGGGVP